MKYFSTRNKKIKYSFKDIFFSGLAPDGGLFVPETVPRFDEDYLNKLKKLNYANLATEIISHFCDKEITKAKLKNIIEKSYYTFLTENVVSIKKFDQLNILELYHGPTLAFKDIAMQPIGHLYSELNKDSNKTINIIVATSGDTGAAAINAMKQRKNINLFILHPHNKISKMQRKIMTSENFYYSNEESKNIYNIAIKGNFDDCQKLVKDMFTEIEFRNKINISGVNSINWSRIIFQIVYYFYAFFKISKKELNFSVPTGNFGDVYAGYIAKKMGLPINKFIVSTNENDILQRVINTGEYKPETVKNSLSPSMDIQIASNFERLLFDALDSNDEEVRLLMEELKEKKSFKLNKQALSFIKEHFYAEKITDKETIETIKTIYKKYNFIIDPHTATAVKAYEKIDQKIETVILATAHPYKFVETIESITNEKLEPPIQVLFLGPKERYDIIDCDINIVKKYIESKIQ
jgi:threonine synthase